MGAPTRSERVTTKQQTIEGNVVITGDVEILGGINNSEIQRVTTALEIASAGVETVRTQAEIAAENAQEAAANVVKAVEAAGVYPAYAGGTYTPEIPVVAFSAYKRSLSARITPQGNLLNADGWDVQIQRPTDGDNWYCPKVEASSDADSYYTGNAGDWLKIDSPDFTLQFLPIPLDGNALPVVAGQEYRLRIRARCSSPVDKSDWSTSAALKVKPISGLDIATAQVTAALLAAGAAKGNLAVDGDVIAQGLRAISANLGVITAGKLRSADWVSGVSGFEVDLDAGTITQAAGRFKLHSNGLVELYDVRAYGIDYEEIDCGDYTAISPDEGYGEGGFLDCGDYDGTYFPEAYLDCGQVMGDD